jgi:hypothetical protein
MIIKFDYKWTKEDFLHKCLWCKEPRNIKNSWAYNIGEFVMDRIQVPKDFEGIQYGYCSQKCMDSSESGELVKETFSKNTGYKAR